MMEPINLSVIVFIAVVIYFFYCIVQMSRNMTPGAPRWPAWVSAGLTRSDLYTEKGNKYRRRALAMNILGLVLVYLLWGDN